MTREYWCRPLRIPFPPRLRCRRRHISHIVRRERVNLVYVGDKLFIVFFK